MAPLLSRTPGLSLVVLLVLCSAGCGASTDAVASLEPIDVVTGWFDDGIIEGGKNKLVPSVSLKLRNKGSAPLRSVH